MNGNSIKDCPPIRAMSPPEAVFWSVVDKVVDFCRRNQSRVKGLDGVEFPHLREEIAFHAVRGTLAVVWAGDEIAGVALCWQTTAHEIYAAEQAGRQVFDWKPTNPKGNAVYLGLVVVEQPRAMLPMAQYYLRRFPAWATLPTFAHRRGRLVVATGLLARLASKGKE